MNANDKLHMTLINETLQQYIDAIDSGFGLIGGDVRWLFSTLLVLNIVIVALFWAFSEDQVLVPLIRKAIYVGIFAFIIENWLELTNVWAHTFVVLGLKAGGGTMSQDLWLNPGVIAERGLTTAEPIMNAMHELARKGGFFENFPEIFLLGLAVLVVLVAFVSIALQLVMAILTFKLGTLAAFVLLPFSLISHTAFIAERPLGWVVSAGVRFMLLTLVVGIGENIFSQLKVDPQFDVPKALNVALAALVLMVLALTVSRLATDLATGTPRLGAFDAGLALSGVAASTYYLVKNTFAAGRGLYKGGKLAVVKAASALNRGGSASAQASSLTSEPKKP